MMDKYCPYCNVFFQFFGSTIAFELFIATYSVNNSVNYVLLSISFSLHSGTCQTTFSMTIISLPRGLVSRTLD